RFSRNRRSHARRCLGRNRAALRPRRGQEPFTTLVGSARFAGSRLLAAHRSHADARPSEFAAVVLALWDGHGAAARATLACRILAGGSDLSEGHPGLSAPVPGLAARLAGTGRMRDWTVRRASPYSRSCIRTVANASLLPRVDRSAFYARGSGRRRSVAGQRIA